MPITNLETSKEILVYMKPDDGSLLLNIMVIKLFVKKKKKKL